MGDLFNRAADAAAEAIGELQALVGRRRAPGQEAQKMAALLPYRLREYLNFKVGVCAVASALLRQAKPARSVEITVEELAALAGLEERSVRRAFIVLEDAGLLDREHRRIRREMHLPSRYHLLGDLAFFAEGGDTGVRQNPGKNNYISTSTTNRLPTTDRVSSQKDNAPRRGIGGQAPAPTRALPLCSPGASMSVPTRSASDNQDDLVSAEKSLQPAVPVVLTVEDSPADWTSLATRAARALDPDYATDENPWAALDLIRQARLQIEPLVWAGWASLHKHRALLAVAETLLRPVGYFRTSKLRYLAGILRKEPAACAPERSLARLLAETDGSAQGAASPALPLGVKSLQPPPEVPETDQPRPKSRLHGQLYDLVGPATYRSWFRDLSIDLKDGLLHLSGPQRFTLSRIREKFDGVLRQAFTVDGILYGGR
jgi:DNA-binding transcriptional ArsR family regulator